MSGLAIIERYKVSAQVPGLAKWIDETLARAERVRVLEKALREIAYHINEHDLRDKAREALAGGGGA